MLLTIRETNCNLAVVGWDASFSQIKLFREIASTRSVSKGADLSGVSQSAASQMLKALEVSLGVKLLDSSTRPLTVTAHGRLYLEMCRDVLRRREEFQADLDRLRDQVEGTVRVASIYSVGVSEMSELERAFSQQQPGSKLEVEYLRPEKVYESVVSDRADIGLISYPEQTREVRVIDWRREEMVVAVAPGHELASRTSVSASDLEGREFIGFDEDLPIRQEIDRYLANHGVDVRVTLHFDNLQSLKEAVAETKSAVSILPGRVLRRETAIGRLVAIPIDAPGLYRPLGIIHRRKKTFHPAAQAFLELLQQTPG
jgi:LysR family transcriptional regulator, transcriptional activator of the cysJI operon